MKELDFVEFFHLYSLQNAAFSLLERFCLQPMVLLKLPLCFGICMQIFAFARFATRHF